MMDKTYNEKIFDLNQSFYINTTRTVRASFAAREGNFTTSHGSGFSAEGRYFPSLKRGVAEFLVPSIFKFPKFNQNEEDLYKEAQLQQWPAAAKKVITPEEIVVAESDAIRQKDCTGLIYFELVPQCRQPSPYYEYVADRQRLEVLDGRLVNSTCELVHNMQYTAVSHNCAFVLEGSPQIYNAAEVQKRANYLYIIMLAVSALQTIVVIPFLFGHNMRIIDQIPIPGMIMWVNAAYVYLVFCQLLGSLQPTTYKLASLLTMLQFVSLVTPVTKLTFKLIQLCRERWGNRLCSLVVAASFTLLSMLPGIIILAISFYADFVTVTSPLTVILYNWLLMYELWVIISPKYVNIPPIPTQIFVVDYIPKFILVGYGLCCPKSFLQFESRWWWVFLLLLPVPLLFVYAIQRKKGIKFGYIPKSSREVLFDYRSQLLFEYALGDCQPQEYGRLIPFANKELGRCSNPMHQHSKFCAQTDPDQNQWLFDNQQKSSGQIVKREMCYCAVGPDFVMECGICLDEIDITDYISNICSGTVGISKQLTDGQLVPRRQMYVTPCGHQFHEDCLKTWLDQNQICPVDRKELPAPNE